MDKPIIIFEGLDRVGKGSHIEKFTRILEEFDSNYFTFHCEGPDKNIAISAEEKIYYQMFTFYNQLKTISSINSTIIFDRSFFGEMVWSKYYNRMTNNEKAYYEIDKNYLGTVVESIMNTDVYKKLQDKMFVVFLDGNENNIIKRITESEEDTRVYTKFKYNDIEKNVKFIKNEFNNLCKILTDRGLKTIKLNSNVPSDIDNNVKTIFTEVKGLF